jgi:hypothetical protein
VRVDATAAAVLRVALLVCISCIERSKSLAASSLGNLRERWRPLPSRQRTSQEPVAKPRLMTASPSEAPARERSEKRSDLSVTKSEHLGAGGAPGRKTQKDPALQGLSHALEWTRTTTGR